MLRVHPKHLYRLLREGLPGHRVGRGHWRFRRDEVLAWVARREAPRSHDDRLDATWVGSSTPSPGAQRVLLGRVGDRWVAHPLGAARPRSADALVEIEAPVERSLGSVRATALRSPEELGANLLVAGCAPVLGVILDRIERAGPGRGHWLPYNSGDALEQLAAGTIHVAGLHLEDPETGEDHRALLRRRFADEPVRLVKLVRWRTGLAVRPELRDRPLPELLHAPVRWVQREPGAGVRRVLARVLARLGTTLERLPTTHVARGHLEVAQAIALGIADVGVLVEPVARELGLPFVPLVEEGFDLAVRETHAAPPPIARMLDALDDPALRREIACLGPYDTSTLGHATLA